MRAAVCTLLIILGALPGFVGAVGLRDEPLLGDAVQLLDGLSWTATDNATVIPATVPGDLVTDLQRAGVIGDPLYERNFKALTWEQQWTYKVSFSTASALAPAAGGARWLVLDSVKMGAWVWFNGAFVGAVQDQFLRWTFDVTSLLKAPGAGDNVLTITFALSNHSLNDQARWVACSGGFREGEVGRRQQRCTRHPLFLSTPRFSSFHFPLRRMGLVSSFLTLLSSSFASTCYYSPHLYPLSPLLAGQCTRQPTTALARTPSPRALCAPRTSSTTPRRT